MTNENRFNLSIKVEYIESVLHWKYVFLNECQKHITFNNVSKYTLISIDVLINASMIKTYYICNGKRAPKTWSMSPPMPGKPEYIDYIFGQHIWETCGKILQLLHQWLDNEIPSPPLRLIISRINSFVVNKNWLSSHI